nr:hypothetical protein [uncultured Carboxylicivirga sp.]
MKNFKFILLTLVTLAVFSCNKDDESPNGSSVTMNDKNFSINTAAILGVSIDDSGHTGITFASGTETQGTILSIDVESFTKETIEGHYSYPQTKDSKLLDNWLTNYVTYDNSDMISSNLQWGNLTIKHNGGNNYTVEMDLTMEDGVVFEGTYTGEFTVMFMN